MNGTSQGSTLTVIGILGVLFSGSVICSLLFRRIRLSCCQNHLIINVAFNDLMLSIAGIFRGLGIINSKFVGAPNKTSTPFCVAYTLFLNTFGFSVMLTLLPLTIDRTVAILLPLHHSSIITHRTCALMFWANWLPMFGLLLFYIVTYSTGAIDISYYHRYHRCVISGGSFGEIHEDFAFIIPPLLLIILMYIMMLYVVIRKTDRGGRFLFTAIGIVTSSMLAYGPAVITTTWNISPSYEVSQTLTVTVYYINGVINPLIYVATHPLTWKYVKTMKERKSTRKQSVNSCVTEPCKSKSKSKSKPGLPSSTLPVSPDTVCLANISVIQQN